MNLEEVKEHFKDAKEVRCLSDGKVYNIDGGNFITNYYNVNLELIHFQHGNICVTLYVKGDIAEIISYKEDLPEGIFEERVMLVSDDEESWCKRVVFMKKNNRFIAWNHAETIEEAGGVLFTTDWSYAKEVPKEIEVTKEEIAKWKGCDVNQLIIK